MDCTFCVTEDDFEPIAPGAALELLDRLAAEGVRTVTFGGGEPFAWPHDVLNLARAAKQRGLFVQIGTNGIALPAGFEELDEVDRWVMPLESTDARIHDSMRLHRGGHHALQLERLAALQKVGKSVTLSTVLTQSNQQSLPGLAEHLREYHAITQNIHAWHIYRFLPLGRGGSRNKRELDLTRDQYLEACEVVRALELPFTIYRRPDMYRSKTVEFYWSEGGRVVSGSEALH